MNACTCEGTNSQASAILNIQSRQNNNNAAANNDNNEAHSKTRRPSHRKSRKNSVAVFVLSARIKVEIKSVCLYTMNVHKLYSRTHTAREEESEWAWVKERERTNFLCTQHRHTLESQCALLRSSVHCFIFIGCSLDGVRATWTHTQKQTSDTHLAHPCQHKCTYIHIIRMAHQYMHSAHCKISIDRLENKEIFKPSVPHGRQQMKKTTQQF